MKLLDNITDNKDIVNKQYVDNISGVKSVNNKTGQVVLTADDIAGVPLWDSTVAYPSGAYVIHNGYLWKNTSGADTVGVEPGQNGAAYSTWNVTYSNKNMINNAFFRLNQRGLTRYEGKSAYTIDRWRTGSVGSGYITYDTSEYSITLYGDGSNRESCIQLLGFYLPMGTYTLSAIVKGNGRITLTKGLNVVNSVTFTNVQEYIVSSMCRVVNADSINGIGLQSAADGEASFLCVKLETGNISTLMNDIPTNYGINYINCVTSTADSTDTYANKTIVTT